MNYLEIEYKKRIKEWYMTDLMSHDYYELYFLLSGSSRFFYKEEFYELSAPALCVISPYQPHKTEGEECERININVSKSELTEKEEEYLKELGDNVVYGIDKEKLKEILVLLNYASKIKDETNEKTNAIRDFFHTLIHILKSSNGLISLKNEKKERLTKKDSTIMQIVAYFNENFNEKITIKGLCEKFYLSKNTLCKNFKKVMGFSVLEYANYVRINKAKELLSLGKTSVEEIAERCGYISANYFGLAFKKAVGVSPVAYKKSKK